ncbi:HlyD family secretion protein [Acuticoccus sediminis]|uniref:HlyD family secretion protein n=1 Tax=Acuticoccus sediminis TaxID=2184697 RepID=UPI001CFD6B47|nr:HlyD family secretion protein [Acuticoccus sediminis]
MIIVRLLFTTVLTISAIYAGLFVWNGIFHDPWTRDAHVRADIVEAAPRVSGEIVDIAVRNNMAVRKGDLILTVDQTDYQLALEQAKAARDEAEASLEIARQQSSRYDQLKQKGSISVAAVDIINADLATKSAEAAVKAADAALKVAQVNLDRTEMRSPVDGIVTNLAADTGDYATAGVAIVAMVDTNSFRIDAFFLETQLARIRTGDRARVRFMANGEVVQGHVSGIAAGIAYSEDTSTTLLQAPEPSFQWVRLAQRVPVEITLDARPVGIPLVNGATTTVIIEPSVVYDRTLWRKLMDRIDWWRGSTGGTAPPAPAATHHNRHGGSGAAPGS